MKITIKRDTFFKEVQKIQSITPLKGTTPILSCFLLEATKDGIFVFATDLDVGMKIFIKADVSEPGKICLPAKVVYDILRELPEKTSIDLILEDNNRLRLGCMNSVFHVPGITAEEFPSFPDFELEETYPIPMATLMDMFLKVNVAVPVFEQKLYNAPAGALFAVKDKGIEMVGTDGHRMAYTYMEELGFPVQTAIILPKKLLDELPKIMADFEKTQGNPPEKKEKDHSVKVGLAGNHSIFALPHIQIFARLLENKFPDYRGPITAENDKLVIINKDRFRQAVRRVSLITEKREWFILFKLTQGKLLLDSESADVGDAHDEIDVEYQGEALEIGFNPKYILDFLAVMDSPEVALEMSDNESLAIMRPKDRENIKFIIMPVRL